MLRPGGRGELAIEPLVVPPLSLLRNVSGAFDVPGVTHNLAVTLLGRIGFPG